MPKRCDLFNDTGLRRKTLTNEVKLTEFGAATPTFRVSKEDEQSAALAARAQKGDYDDGAFGPLVTEESYLMVLS
jgi:hypothetical protein